MSGLFHGADLEAWRTWQRSRSPWSRRIRTMLPASRSPLLDPEVSIVTRARNPRALFILDSLAPSSRLSLLMAALELGDQAVIVSPSDPKLTPPWTHQRAPFSTVLPATSGVSLVLSSGHYLPLGALGYAAAHNANIQFVTVQHGLLTPHAPPLAPGTTLLAWSDADGDFWRSGREDVDVHVVGSQLLWNAAHHPAPSPTPDSPPLFLGQLHGAELPRRVLARTAEEFCRREHAAYRPHPSESDKRSRLTHRRWERQGITIERSGVPLTELDTPVVSTFSTGVLEAAARGIPAWVTCTDPPAWLRQFWARYDMRTWGGAPTPPPALPATEPARAIADLVTAMMDP